MASYLMPREFAYDVRSFQWLSRFHAGSAIALAGLGFVLLRILAINMIITVMLLFSSVLVFISLGVNAMAPMLTKHLVTGETVVFKQGILFDLTVPFENIGKVRISDDIPRKRGVYASGTEAALYILASGKRGVKMTLRSELRVKRRTVDTIIADLEDPEGFLECLNERMKGKEILAAAGKKARKTAIAPAEKYDPLLPRRKTRGENPFPAGPRGNVKRLVFPPAPEPEVEEEDQEVSEADEEPDTELIPAAVPPRRVRIPKAELDAPVARRKVRKTQ